VRHGATALFLLGDPATIPALAGLLETPTFETTESANGSYRLIAELDFQHPSFAPFADNRYSDFSRIHFWRHRRLDPALLPGARVLARLDNDDPWLLECLLGRGRVLVATSGWQPAESQLALSSKFVPLLYSFLELSRLGTTPPSQFSVGNPVPIPVEWLDGEPVTVESPSGSLETLPAGSTTFTRTLQPGLYQIRHALGHLTFSVNLDPAETRTAPLPPDTLEQLGAPARATPAQAATATPARLRDAELESRQKLWRWCLLASIAFLILEAWLSGRALRRNTFAAQPAPSPARS
jgi:hypothetical protein